MGTWLPPRTYDREQYDDDSYGQEQTKTPKRLYQ